MSNIFSEDTIVALSTASGKGAIAVIRLSGPDCLKLINKVFSKQLSEQNHRTAEYGTLSDQKLKKTIDQVVVTFFKSPNSYTGEDLIEISCHGNNLIVAEIMEIFIENGARPAEPGEFTKRAFLNQKLDLTQAEAVANVIDSQTRQSLLYNMRQLEGKLSEKVKNLREDIIRLASLIEVSLDFNEDDVEIYTTAQADGLAKKIIEQIDQLLSTYKLGRLLNEGIRIVLLGRPNVGKSSLLNRLLEHDRAIVSEIPGTTRDYIEAQLEINGIPVQLIDTAGVRETVDPIEGVGVQKTLGHIDKSDILLAMFDAHADITADDRRLIQYLSNGKNLAPAIFILNKSDLGINPETHSYLKKFNHTIIELSAKTGENLSKLKAGIVKNLFEGRNQIEDEIVLTNARHQTALTKGRKELNNFMAGLHSRTDEVVLAANLRSAMDHLGDLIGETTPNDILNNIFGSFCIGK